MVILLQLKAHRAFLVLLLIAATLFLSDLWTYKEFVRAESYFALGARLMIDEHQWIAPHAPDELELNKPPLTYWLIGFTYHLFGSSYGTARLVSVISALGVLVIIYFLGLRLDGKRTAFTSAALLTASYLFFTFARTAMSDMLLTLCVTGALGGFVLALITNKPTRLLVIAAYALLALGVLTKGPVALVLIALPIICELAIARERADFRRLHLWIGPAISLLIIAPYLFLVYRRLGPEPFSFFLMGENYARFTGAVYGFGTRPFWYEIVAFFSDFAPWSLLIFPAFYYDWRGRRTIVTEGRGIRIVYLWLVITVVLFTFSSFKRDYYLLPAMPAAALIVGRFLAHADALVGPARRLVKALMLLCVLMLVLGGLFSLYAAKLFALHATLPFLPATISVAGAVFVIALLVRGKICQSAMALAAAIGGTILIVQWTFTPAFSRYLPVVGLANSVPADREVYTSRATTDWANCLAFNLPHSRVERLTPDFNNRELQDVLRNNSRAVVLVGEKEYFALMEQGLPLRIIGQGDTFGHGGLNANVLNHPKLERLYLVVGKD